MVLRSFRRLLSELPATAAGAVESPTADDPSDGPAAGRTRAGTAADAATDALDVCLLSYRSNPYSGGQGVYVRFLSRALVGLGHDVTVVSGKPYPDLVDDVDLVKLPGENVVDDLDRFGQFEPSYLRDPLALYEWASALTGGFPDPYAFGRRVVSYFETHDPDFDVIHDNQSLCYGLATLAERGYPVVATIHHPITADREVALEAADGLVDRLLTRRWYRFLRMQKAVASDLPHLVTVSESARRRTIEDFDADPDAVRVVHNGIDTETFRPRDVDAETDRFRILSTLSADSPLKGGRYLLSAFAQVRERIDAELAVVGEFTDGGATADLVADLGIGDAITTYDAISQDRLVELYGTADVAVVPSLYEGFGLPAGEAMACEVPVVATTGGGLPEVVGDAGLTVPTRDADALAEAVIALAEDPARRRRLGRRGRERVVETFDWERTARETVREYRSAIEADGDD